MSRYDKEATRRDLDALAAGEAMGRDFDQPAVTPQPTTAGVDPADYDQRDNEWEKK